ncbi:MAG: GlsB/YeaQ/YmgE family stress response membrane protein [Myxococcaceae bacterium]|nr:GlsB/YeaQ/YmgE family stress response membrane protein [Myxococcaceae bacterium]
MNPALGFVSWIVIGGIAGWVGSMIMGTNERQGTIANIIVGVVGAVVGGVLTGAIFGDNPGNNGLFASFGVALLGSCVFIAILRFIGGSGRSKPAV